MSEQPSPIQAAVERLRDYEAHLDKGGPRNEDLETLLSCLVGQQGAARQGLKRPRAADAPPTSDLGGSTQAQQHSAAATCHQDANTAAAAASSSAISLLDVLHVLPANDIRRSLWRPLGTQGRAALLSTCRAIRALACERWIHSAHVPDYGQPRTTMLNHELIAASCHFANHSAQLLPAVAMPGAPGTTRLGGPPLLALKRVVSAVWDVASMAACMWLLQRAPQAESLELDIITDYGYDFSSDYVIAALKLPLASRQLRTLGIRCDFTKVEVKCAALAHELERLCGSLLTAPSGSDDDASAAKRPKTAGRAAGTNAADATDAVAAAPPAAGADRSDDVNKGLHPADRGGVHTAVGSSSRADQQPQPQEPQHGTAGLNRLMLSNTYGEPGFPDYSNFEEVGLRSIAQLLPRMTTLSALHLHHMFPGGCGSALAALEGIAQLRRLTELAWGDKYTSRPVKDEAVFMSRLADTIIALPQLRVLSLSGFPIYTVEGLGHLTRALTDPAGPGARGSLRDLRLMDCLRLRKRAAAYQPFFDALAGLPGLKALTLSPSCLYEVAAAAERYDESRGLYVDWSEPLVQEGVSAVQQLAAAVSRCRSLTHLYLKLSQKRIKYWREEARLEQVCDAFFSALGLALKDGCSALQRLHCEWPAREGCLALAQGLPQLAPTLRELCITLYVDQGDEDYEPWGKGIKALRKALRQLPALTRVAVDFRILDNGESVDTEEAEEEQGDEGEGRLLSMEVEESDDVEGHGDYGGKGGGGGGRDAMRPKELSRYANKVYRPLEWAMRAAKLYPARLITTAYAVGPYKDDPMVMAIGGGGGGGGGGSDDDDDMSDEYSSDDDGGSSDVDDGLDGYGGHGPFDYSDTPAGSEGGSDGEEEGDDDDEEEEEEDYDEEHFQQDWTNAYAVMQQMLFGGRGRGRGGRGMAGARGGGGAVRGRGRAAAGAGELGRGRGVGRGAAGAGRGRGRGRGQQQQPAQQQGRGRGRAQAARAHGRGRGRGRGAHPAAAGGRGGRMQQPARGRGRGRG